MLADDGFQPVSVSGENLKPKVCSSTDTKRVERENPIGGNRCKHFGATLADN